MKFRWLTFLLLFTVLGLSAQIDSENKSIAIPAEEIDDPKEDNEIIVQPAKKNDAKKNNDAETEVTLSKDEQMKITKRKAFSMIHDDKLKSPVGLYKKQLKSALQLRKDEYRNEGRSVDQFFGKYYTKSKYQNVMLRDFGLEDGDLVRIYVNGIVVKSRVSLENLSRNFLLTLELGENVIEFEALNQGTSGPNTAGFAVFEKTTGNELLSSNWNLLTGVKGTINIVLLPEDEKKEEE